MYAKSHVAQKNILAAKYNENSLSCQEAPLEGSAFGVDNNKSYAKITSRHVCIKAIQLRAEQALTTLDKKVMGIN